jgi:type IV pilus assembly protein PilO
MSSNASTVWRERLVSPLMLHIAGAAILLLLVIVLGVRFRLDWAATSSSSSESLIGKQVELKALELGTAPLRGLDIHVMDSRAQLENIYAKRIPSSYSVIATRIGELQVKSGTRLTRVQYAQGKAGNVLTEITMDAGITGTYPGIMKFVNSLEHDQMFFVIRAMSFTGQQGGLVSLRIRISTWLRPADAEASGLPADSDENVDKSSAAAIPARSEKEGR